MHTLKRKRQVIVIGAGPAGALAAFVLADSGRDVLVCDRASFPRTKRCAGAVSSKAMSVLPAIDDSVWMDELTTLTISYRNRRVSHTAGEPYARTVSRARFDHALLHAAEVQGAEVLSDCHVESLHQDRSGPMVIIDGQAVRCEVVIDARGCKGLNSSNSQVVGFGLEKGIDRSKVGVEMSPGEVLVDLKPEVSGYTWLIPRNDEVSVGAVGFRHQGKRLRSVMGNWVDSVSDQVGVGSIAGHPLPGTAKKPSCVDGSVLRVGDAAGLCDVLIGEGIFRAMWSGMAAARVVHLYLAGRESLSVYDRWLEEDVWPELARARTLSRILYGATWLSMLWCRLKPSLLQEVVATVGGWGSYEQVFARIWR